jgi:hypothetical protein
MTFNAAYCLFPGVSERYDEARALVDKSSSSCDASQMLFERFGTLGEYSRSRFIGDEHSKCVKFVDDGKVDQAVCMKKFQVVDGALMSH